ncbi:CD80-like immunoglobulin C2-set [Trinorchestia longiramus]|nr:CD80-like immunoglobulin C2-set [Trinorchestia longiramus]
MLQSFFAYLSIPVPVINFLCTPQISVDATITECNNALLQMSQIPQNFSMLFLRHGTSVLNQEWAKRLVPIALFYSILLSNVFHRLSRRVVHAEVGGEAVLPCGGGLRIAGDQPTLLLWYRHSYTEPVYSYDTRDGAWTAGEHWMDSEILGSRAQFKVFPQPPVVTTELPTSRKTRKRKDIDFKSQKMPPQSRKSELDPQNEREKIEILFPKADSDSSQVTQDVRVMARKIRSIAQKYDSFLQKTMEFNSTKPLVRKTESITRKTEGLLQSKRKNQQMSSPSHYKLNRSFMNTWYYDQNLSPIARKIRKKRREVSEIGFGSTDSGPKKAVHSDTRGKITRRGHENGRILSRNSCSNELLGLHGAELHPGDALHDNVNKINSNKTKSFELQLSNLYRSYFQFYSSRKVAHIRHLPQLFPHSSYHFTLHEPKSCLFNRVSNGRQIPRSNETFLLDALGRDGRRENSMTRSRKRKNAATSDSKSIENRMEHSLLRGKNSPLEWNSAAIQGNEVYDNSNTLGALVLTDVRAADHGPFTCRVEYRRAPTSYSTVQLYVVLPPSNPTLQWRGQAVNGGVIGPLKEGSYVHVTCHSSGGRPPPVISWWKAGRRLQPNSHVTDRHANDSEKFGYGDMISNNKKLSRKNLNINTSNTEHLGEFLLMSDDAIIDGGKKSDENLAQRNVKVYMGNSDRRKRTLEGTNYILGNENVGMVGASFQEDKLLEAVGELGLNTNDDYRIGERTFSDYSKKYIAIRTQEEKSKNEDRQIIKRDNRKHSKLKNTNAFISSTSKPVQILSQWGNNDQSKHASKYVSKESSTIEKMVNEEGNETVSSTITLYADRAMLNVPVICQATTPSPVSSITVVGRTTAVVLNITLPPLTVWLEEIQSPVLEGAPFRVKCTSGGSHPPAMLTLRWRGKRLTRVLRSVLARSTSSPQRRLSSCWKEASGVSAISTPREYVPRVYVTGQIANDRLPSFCV